MYDSVKVALYSDMVGNTDFLQETTCYLDDVVACNYGGREYARASLNGLSLKITPDSLKIDKGSLCKYALGDNYKIMCRGDVKRAFEELSDVLHLPMNKAKILRLDIGSNIIVKHPPDVYFKHLGDISRFKRSEIKKGTLYYQQEHTALCLYDKNREQKRQGEAIPELYKDRNVLRAEMRILKSPRKVLQLDSVTAEDLYDEAFYMMMIQRFAGLYKSIRKINDISLNFENMTSVKDLKNYGAIVLIEQMGGQQAVLEQVRIAQEKGEMTATQACRFRQEVDKLCNNTDEVVKHSEEVDELDKKINEAIKFYR